MTRSDREGLLGPAYWALSVRMVTSARGGMALWLGVSGLCFSDALWSYDVVGGGGIWSRVCPADVGALSSGVGEWALGLFGGEVVGESSPPGVDGGEYSSGYSTGGGVWIRIRKFGSGLHPRLWRLLGCGGRVGLTVGRTGRL